MDLNEYIARKAAILQALAAIVLLLLRPFVRFPLGRDGWTGLLYTLYPIVENARYDAARLGREWFDAKRVESQGETIPTYLAPYTFEEFSNALEPSRRMLDTADSPNSAVLEIMRRITKEVENGGRRTIIRAVRNDEVRPGWARFDPRPPTCAFCTMLISRGPVYESAESAGSALSDEETERLIASASDLSADDFRKQLMNDFHPGCTCLVIPVYDKNSWEGREQFLEARNLWREETQGYGGLDALNALRRALYSSDDGESDTRLPRVA